MVDVRFQDGSGLVKEGVVEMIYSSKGGLERGLFSTFLFVPDKLYRC